MKKILFLTFAALLCASTAMASTQTVGLLTQGGNEYLPIHMTSGATNAIDTVTVAVAVNPEYRTFAISLVADSTLAKGMDDYWWIWPINATVEGKTATGGSGTTDSVQVAIDVSFDKVNWVQASALGPTAGVTNAAPNEQYLVKFNQNLAEGLRQPAPFMRVRLKNLGAGTGAADVTLVWPKAK